MKEFEKIIDSIKRQLIPNDPTTHVSKILY